MGLKAILQEPSLTNLTVKVTVLDANLSPHFIPGVGLMGTGKCGGGVFCLSKGNIRAYDLNHATEFAICARNDLRNTKIDNPIHPLLQVFSDCHSSNISLSCSLAIHSSY